MGSSPSHATPPALDIRSFASGPARNPALCGAGRSATQATARPTFGIGTRAIPMLACARLQVDSEAAAIGPRTNDHGDRACASRSIGRPRAILDRAAEAGGPQTSECSPRGRAEARRAESSRWKEMVFRIAPRTLHPDARTVEGPADTGSNNPRPKSCGPEPFSSHTSQDGACGPPRLGRSPAPQRAIANRSRAIYSRVSTQALPSQQAGLASPKAQGRPLDPHPPQSTRLAFPAGGVL
jgi:hypothetical protein